MRLDSVSAMHFLSLIKVCILIVWCIAIRPWLLVPLKPLSNTVHHWMLSLAKENFLPSVFCSILFSRIKEGYQNSHNSRILKVLVWVTMTRGQQPPVELETKDADDYAKFYIHREGLYWGLLLVESNYKRFHIHTIKTLCWTDVDPNVGVG